MSQSTDARSVVHDTLDGIDGGPVAALRRSGVHRWRTLPVDEFIWSIGELAACDASLGWLAGNHGVAAWAMPAAERHWEANPDALIAVGHRGGAHLTGGRLAGRWEAVVGAEHADWFLLACGHRYVPVPATHVRTDIQVRPAGLAGAGIGDVVVAGFAVDDLHTGVADPVVAAAAAASVVVGTAHGCWQRHVDQVRARLAISYGGDEITDEAAAQIARTASDIDASRLQIGAAGGAGGTAGYGQAIARARAATDDLMASSRHALDASDPVTSAWRDLHAGCRLATAVI